MSSKKITIFIIMIVGCLQSNSLHHSRSYQKVPNSLYPFRNYKVSGWHYDIWRPYIPCWWFRWAYFAIYISNCFWLMLNNRSKPLSIVGSTMSTASQSIAHSLECKMHVSNFLAVIMNHEWIIIYAFYYIKISNLPWHAKSMHETAEQQLIVQFVQYF